MKKEHPVFHRYDADEEARSNNCNICCCCYKSTYSQCAAIKTKCGAIRDPHKLSTPVNYHNPIVAEYVVLNNEK
jgi:hypothetical protein